jgi:chromosome segregation ATPase
MRKMPTPEDYERLEERCDFLARQLETSEERVDELFSKFSSMRDDLCTLDGRVSGVESDAQDAKNRADDAMTRADDAVRQAGGY